MDLLLASTSPVRRVLLEGAGVEFEAIAPEVDEGRIKQGFAGDDAALALELAAAKAASVVSGRTGLVLGSDSIVSVEGRRFSKPGGREEAAEHLRLFSGRVMELTSAAVLFRGGEQCWSVADRARLSVRRLSEEFIADYLDREWPDVAYCVGVFRIEGRGVQLFERAEGDHFTILGLPLLPLLGELRRQGVMPS